jgi:enterochelin esterase-like enzyme
MRNPSVRHFAGDKQLQFTFNAATMWKIFLLLSFVLVTTALSAADEKAPDGRIETLTLTSRVFGNQRYIRVWLPPGYDSAPSNVTYPVLYLNDGQFIYHATSTKDMRGDWHAEQIAAKLIAKGKIEPLIIVAIDNSGREGRAREYLPIVDATYRPAMKDAVGEHYPEIIFDEVVPLINSRYRTRSGPEGLALGGSSFGAVAALHCAIVRPGAVGRLLLESPSLYVGEGWLFKQSEAVSQWPAKIYVGVGTLEVPGNDEYSREAVDDVYRLEKMLKKTGVSKDQIKVAVEIGGTHVEDAWARRLPAALQFLFGKDRD